MKSKRLVRTSSLKLDDSRRVGELDSNENTMVMQLNKNSSVHRPISMHKLFSTSDKYKQVDDDGEVQVNFIDVKNCEFKDHSDLDNVILTDQQKWRLVKQIIKSKEFWILYTMQLLSIFYGYYMVNVYKAFGITIPVLDNDAFLTTVNSVSSLFNSARFVWSGALDKVSFKYLYAFMVCMQIAMAFSISVTVETKFTYAMVVCLTLFCIGAHFALFPNLLK